MFGFKVLFLSADTDSTSSADFRTNRLRLNRRLPRPDQPKKVRGELQTGPIAAAHTLVGLIVSRS